MRVLGIDTSGYANTIGVVDGDRVLADFALETRNESLAKIILNVDSVSLVLTCEILVFPRAGCS